MVYSSLTIGMNDSSFRPCGIRPRPRRSLAAMINTKMTRSEKIVTGLAVAVLVAGFATGVFARPLLLSPKASASFAHVVAVVIHRDK